MQGFVRAKRVTDPLNDKVRAQLVKHQLSFVSSGSDHSGADDDSPCLSELVHDFLEHKPQDQPPGYDSDGDSVRAGSAIDSTEKLEEVLRTTANGDADLYRNLLLTHILKAMEMISCLRQEKTILRRKVMSFLRELGHNAAICKTKWNASGGLNNGNYEFIDVVQSSSRSTQNRYLIDLDFAAEFQIARPTDEYKRAIELLPRVYVGKSEELKKIVKVMSNAVKKSFKARDLTLPPWRKNRYMQNKWFAPYKRTVNPTAAVSLAAALPPVDNKSVHCRRVGFDDGLNGRLYVRTR